ncbi:MAG: TRL-like family protein [Spirochaetia bacterium]|nr:TRL-like family protein [Spirochaetia bacterium]
MASLLIGGGCLSAPLQGIAFTYSTSNVHDRGGSIPTSASVKKSGKDCLYGIPIVGWFWNGPSQSIQKAAAEAGISKIAVVDHNSLNVFGRFFYRECVVVWGE